MVCAIAEYCQKVLKRIRDMEPSAEGIGDPVRGLYYHLLELHESYRGISPPNNKDGPSRPYVKTAV
jgi:hypothetical protein